MIAMFLIAMLLFAVASVGMVFSFLIIVAVFIGFVIFPLMPLFVLIGIVKVAVDILKKIMCL